MVGPDADIVRVAGIEQAGPGDLTFVSNRKYIRHIPGTRASAIILGEDIPAVEIPSLRTDDPYLAFARALELFFEPCRPEPGVHPAAVVAPTALLGPGVCVGPCAVIGERCRVGAGTVIHPHVVLYPGAEIGPGCVLHSGVVVREGCRVGDRVVLQNGVVVGGDGFGFAPTRDGAWHKIPQTGRAVIEDDVEVGANSTIDRAAVGDTVVRRGAKLDNLVQVGHGAEVGACSVVAAPPCGVHAPRHPPWWADRRDSPGTWRWGTAGGPPRAAPPRVPDRRRPSPPQMRHTPYAPRREQHPSRVPRPLTRPRLLRTRRPLSPGCRMVKKVRALRGSSAP